MDIFEKKFSFTESVGGGPSVGLKDKLFHGYESALSGVCTDVSGEWRGRAPG